MRPQGAARRGFERESVGRLLYLKYTWETGRFLQGGAKPAHQGKKIKETWKKTKKRRGPVQVSVVTVLIFKTEWIYTSDSSDTAWWDKCVPHPSISFDFLLIFSRALCDMQMLYYDLNQTKKFLSFHLGLLCSFTRGKVTHQCWETEPL